MKTKLIRECVEIALAHNNPEDHPQWDAYKHYSFIIQRSVIRAWGTNKTGNPLNYLGYKPHQKIHSETVAYFRASKRLDTSIPFEVVNIRLSKAGTFKTSAPCKCCSAFLENLGCKRIWFSIADGMFGSMGFRD